MTLRDHPLHFAELGMKIATDRTTWHMRCLVLAELLKAQGIDVEHVLRADRPALLEMLKDAPKAA